MTLFAPVAAGYLTYQLINDGLANTLGLETLRQARSINTFPDIELGDQEFCNEEPFIPDSTYKKDYTEKLLRKAKSYFQSRSFSLPFVGQAYNQYVPQSLQRVITKTKSLMAKNAFFKASWTDKVFNGLECFRRRYFPSIVRNAIEKRVLALVVSLGKNLDFAEDLLHSKMRNATTPKSIRTWQVICTLLGAVSTIIAPTLRLHVRKDQIENYFPNQATDSLSPGHRLLKNAKAFKTADLGLAGSIKNGWDGKFLQRAEANPAKFWTGVAQLTAAVALSSMWVLPMVGYSPVMLACFGAGFVILG